MVEARWRRSRGGWGAVAVAALAALGVLGVWLAVARARDDAEQRDDRAALLAADDISRGLGASVAALRGVSALAVDGALTDEEFAAFGAEIVPGSDFGALALAEQVAGADRAAWEGATGATVIATDGTGGFTVAPPAERYVPVRSVFPLNDGTRSVIGFDLLSDPVRGRGVEEAQRSDEPVIVGPIRTALNAAPGVFVVTAVRDASGAPVATIASGVDVGALADRLDELPGVDPASVELWIDGTPLTEGSREPRGVTFGLGGRQFTVAATDGAGPAVLAPVLVALAAALSVALLLVVLGREAARRELEERGAAVDRGLADLAARLADARSVDEIDDLVAGAAGVVRAEGVRLARRDPARADRLVVSASVDGTAAASPQPEIDVHAAEPLAESIRRSRTVVARRGSSGVVVAVPLRAGRDDVGALEVRFGSHGARREDEAADAAERLAETVGRALERAVARARSERLSELAQGLSGARTTAEVRTIVAAEGPRLLGVTAVGVEDGAVGDGRRYPLGDDHGDAHLVVHAGEGARWTATTDAVARTLAELAGGAWTRTSQRQREREVLLRLQRSLLMAPPVLEHLDVQVAYQSALDVGIGGDWYSVVDRDDATFLVVGDVAGHGPQAVAVMAEVKTIIRHMLTDGADVATVMRHADVALRRRDAFASAVVAQIDRAAVTVAVFNAGHPTPLVRRGGKVERVGRAATPWLGLGVVPTATTRTFEPGDLIVLYTDGLIEDRRVDIDESITTLGDRLAGGSVVDLAHTLLTERSASRSAETVDDDIAVVVAARR